MTQQPTDNRLRALLELAHQYASDLRYPPHPDSIQRRLERIQRVIDKATEQ